MRQVANDKTLRRVVLVDLRVKPAEIGPQRARQMEAIKAAKGANKRVDDPLWIAGTLRG